MELYPSFSSKEKRELEEIPGRLEKNEARKAEIDDLLISVTDYQEVAKLSDEREALVKESEALEERWMELEEKREQVAQFFSKK